MSLVADTSLELRILAGQLKGASIPLSVGKDIRIGHQLRNDIVLRDPDWKDIRLKMTCDEYTASVEVLSGEVQLLGQTITAPSTITVPSYVPLCIGHTAIAFGDREDGTWERCTQLVPFEQVDNAASSGHEVNIKTNGSESVRSVLEAWKAKLRPRTIAIAAGAVAISLLIATVRMALIGPAPADPLVLAMQIVEDAGFDRVIVQKNEAGSLLLTGFVETDAELATLAQQFDQAHLSAEYRVKSGDNIASQITQIAAMSGLDVTVDSLEDQRFRVNGIMSLEQARALRIKLNDEVGGIESLNIHIEAFPEPTPPAVHHRRGDEILWIKRFPSNRGAIKTRDGSLIMVGGVLPNGFRVVEFGADGLHLERNGKRIIQEYPKLF